MPPHLDKCFDIISTFAFVRTLENVLSLISLIRNVTQNIGFEVMQTACKYKYDYNANNIEIQVRIGLVKPEGKSPYNDYRAYCTHISSGFVDALNL